LPKPDKIVGEIESGLTKIYCNSKNLGLSRKTLRPTWCPKLVTGLLQQHGQDVATLSPCLLL